MGLRSRILKAGYPLVRLFWKVWKPYHRTIRVVVRNSGDVLLVRHTYGTQAWGVPGGGLKRGEDPVAAAIRETREETGIELENASLVPGSPFPMVPFGRGELWVVTGDARGRAHRVDGIEIEEIDWFPTDAIPEDMLEQGKSALRATGDVARRHEPAIR